MLPSVLSVSFFLISPWTSSQPMSGGAMSLNVRAAPRDFLCVFAGNHLMSLKFSLNTRNKIFMIHQYYLLGGP